MRLYLALLHHDPDGSYCLIFPDMPGCFAACDEIEDTIPAAQEAIDLWLHRSPDVMPSTMAEISARADVIAARSEGAQMIAVPYIPADGAAGRVNISLGNHLLAAIFWQPLMRQPAGAA